jgi:hypothetical protein
MHGRITIKILSYVLYVQIIGVIIRTTPVSLSTLWLTSRCWIYPPGSTYVPISCVCQQENLALFSIKREIFLYWVSAHLLLNQDGSFELIRFIWNLLRSCIAVSLFTTWFTYFLTPWSRVLLENLTVSQLVKKFPIFYGTRSFITSSTGDRQLSLTWASSIQSIPPHPTSWRSILM